MKPANSRTSAQTILIRRATAQDIAAIEEIERGCFESDGDAFSRRQIAYLVCKARGACFVACNAAGRLLGYISLLTRRGAGNVRIYSVAVSPAARGLGAGQALIAEAIAYARREGFCKVTLEVRTDNTAALAIYQKNGFIPDRLLRGYYHDGADARHMTLTVK